MDTRYVEFQVLVNSVPQKIGFAQSLVEARKQAHERSRRRHV
jgi:hypothetical protein